MVAERASTKREATNVHVPEPTARRLSVYLRELAELEGAGETTVSSRGIAERCRINPAQVRKDLARFGSLGKRGVGYDVAGLRAALARILGLERETRVVIVGAGNLGSALGNYSGFGTSGFRVVALFDNAPSKVGRRTREGRVVRPMSELARVIRDEEVGVGIVAVPAAGAQAVVDALVRAGVGAILNFAPVRPAVPEGTVIRHVDLGVELEGLAFLTTRAAR